MLDFVKKYVKIQALLDGYLFNKAANRGCRRKRRDMKRIHDNISCRTAKIRNEYRNQVDLLRRRVCLLVGKDRVIMTMYLENGASLRQMARLAGVSDAHISRKIKKLIRRLIDGDYIKCLRNRDLFSKNELELAREHLLLGLSIRHISDKREVSYYQIRQTLLKIQRLIDMINMEDQKQPQARSPRYPQQSV